MKQRILIFLSLLCLVAIPSTAKQMMCLVIQAKDGTKVAYALAEKPRLQFNDTELMVTTATLQVSYKRSDILRLTHEIQEVNSIFDISTDSSKKEVNFQFDGNVLMFPKLHAGSIVELHTANSTPVLIRQIATDGEYAFNLGSLPIGVYLVTVNGITHKIAKR